MAARGIFAAKYNHHQTLSNDQGQHDASALLMPCLSVHYIQGGIHAFLNEYPLMDKRISLPPLSFFLVPSQLPKQYHAGYMDDSSSLSSDLDVDLNGGSGLTSDDDLNHENDDDLNHENDDDLNHEIEKFNPDSIIPHAINHGTQDSFIEPFHQIKKEILGSLDGLDGMYPVERLKQWQKTLIDGVWFGKDQDIPVAIVDSFLYLSSCFACTRKHLEENEITHVLRLGWGFQTPHQVDGVTFYEYPISDSPNQPIRQVLEETCGLLDELKRNGARVLVHCRRLLFHILGHAGVSRSSTVVLAYLMKYHQMTLYDAWNMTYKVLILLKYSRLVPSFDLITDSQKHCKILKKICLILSILPFLLFGWQRAIWFIWIMLISSIDWWH
jgi:hypothetical protein